MPAKKTSSQSGVTSRSQAAKVLAGNAPGSKSQAAKVMGGNTQIASSPSSSSKSGSKSGKMSMSDKDIMYDLIGQEKQIISSYATAITETSLQPVRSVLERNFKSACQDQFNTFSMMEQRSFYQLKDAAAKDISTAQNKFTTAGSEIQQL